MLQRLTQQAAGWLIELNGRTLRDHNEIPRDADGRYNARDLLRWAAERVPRPKLDDADYERLLLVADQFTWTFNGECPDGMAVGTYNAMQALEAKHGDGVRVLLADLLMEWLREEDYWQRWEPKPPTAAEVRAELAKQKREHNELVAETTRDISRFSAMTANASDAAGNGGMRSPRRATS